MCRKVLTTLTLCLAAKAFSWGHLDFVGGDWGRSTLPYVLAHSGKISYCIKSDVPDKFPPKNISQQVAKALSVWLAATKKYQNAAVQEVSCEPAKPDLVVQVGPESDFSEMSGYHVPQLEKEHFYSLVKLNSDYTYVEEKSRYQVVDFAQMVPFAGSPLKLMDEVSKEDPMTVGDFSGKYHVHYQRVFLSSYKMLLHEIGHAFGLCDTESALFKYCDSKFRSLVNPPAVMNQANFFYLTDDDKAGLQAVMERFEVQAAGSTGSEARHAGKSRQRR